MDTAAIDLGKIHRARPRTGSDEDVLAPDLRSIGELQCVGIDKRGMGSAAHNPVQAKAALHLLTPTGNDAPLHGHEIGHRALATERGRQAQATSSCQIQSCLSQRLGGDGAGVHPGAAGQGCVYYHHRASKVGRLDRPFLTRRATTDDYKIVALHVQNLPVTTRQGRWTSLRWPHPQDCLDPQWSRQE